jgi:HAMP domain-containing protein
MPDATVAGAAAPKSRSVANGAQLRKRVSPTLESHDLLAALRAFRRGDFSVRLPRGLSGYDGEVAEAFNDVVELNDRMTKEFERLGEVVGRLGKTEGKLGGQAQVKGVTGAWKDLTDNVNFMAANLTGQVRNIAEVTTAVANGDLSRKITVDVKGEILELKNTINTMVDQLNSFASEVT